MTKQITLRVNKTGVTPYDGKMGQLLNFAPNFLISGPSAMVEVTVTDATGDPCEVSVWPKGHPFDATGHGVVVSWHPTATMFSTCFIR